VRGLLSLDRSTASDREGSWPGAVWRSAAAVVVALAGVRLVVQLHSLVAPTEWIVTSLTNDDTYYYLQTAWNHARGGQPTFDGIHRTNGVQLLWYWWAVGLAHLAPSREALLLLTLASCAVLNSFSFFFLWRIGRFTQQPLLAAVASLAWFQASGAVYLSGMENSLHAMLLLWLIDAIIRFLVMQETDDSARRRAVGVALLCTLVVWTRLDSAIVVVPLFLLTLFHSRPRMGWIFGPAVLMAVLGAGLMFGAYAWMAGTVVPVSGLVKTTGYRIDPATVLDLFETTLPLADPFPGYGTSFATVLLGMAGYLALGPWAAPRSYARTTTMCWWVLVVFLFSGSAYLVCLSGLWDSNYSVWCRSPAILSMTLAGAAGIETLIRALRYRIPGGRAQSVLVGALGIFAVAGLFGSYRIAGQEWRRARDVSDAQQILRYRTARWIRLNLPGEVILAADNTGVLAYFSERRSINLDGLINSPEYARGVLGRDDNGRDGRIIEYLERERVDYLVDVDMPEWARNRWPRADFTPQLPQALRTLEETGISAIGSLEVLALKPTGSSRQGHQ
jgi:hypothetical protein